MALSICSLMVPALIPRDLAMPLPDSPLSTLLRRYSYLGFCFSVLWAAMFLDGLIDCIRYNVMLRRFAYVD